MDYKNENTIDITLYGVLLDKPNGEVIVLSVYSSIASAIEHSNIMEDCYVQAYDATMTAKQFEAPAL